MKNFITLLLMATWALVTHAQETTQPVPWKAAAQKTGEKTYRITITTDNPQEWDIYSPDIRFQDIPAAKLELTDSSISIDDGLKAEGKGVIEKSEIFEGESFLVYKGKTAFVANLTFKGDIPAVLNTQLSFTYGKLDEFFPGETIEIAVALEGGKATESRIRISSINPDQPLQNCGISDEKEDSSILNIFLLGFLGGLFALLTPCVFPMVPLTVSYFTKHGNNKEN